ncbi:hypothetical protein OG292_19990 [Streptomyces sp. NBC_01511]|uniref:hypothetical protein n=1 Tax=Streptomyces sp. NBC_01511 TaxID=2903889 RepID=UPI00386BB922
MSITSNEPVTQDARTLLTDEEFARVTATVIGSNQDMAESLAARIVEQAVAFVATCARFPDALIAPSPVVDEGWHALVLDTQLYAALGTSLGAFVHHYPQRPEPSGYAPELTARTLATMEAAGFTPDLELWQGPADNEIVVAATTWHTPSEDKPIVLIPKPKPKG